MAAMTLTAWKVTPGKQQEFLATIAEAKAIHERLGGRVRVWLATGAGPNAGNIWYVIEHDDLAAYASFTQQLQADPEWQTCWAGLQSADPCATLLGNSLATEFAP